MSQIIHEARAAAMSRRGSGNYFSVIEEFLQDYYERIGAVTEAQKVKAKQEFMAEYDSAMRQIEMYNRPDLYDDNPMADILKYPLNLTEAADKGNYMLFSFFQIESPKFKINASGINLSAEGVKNAVGNVVEGAQNAVGDVVASGGSPSGVTNAIGRAAQNAIVTSEELLAELLKRGTGGLGMDSSVLSVAQGLISGGKEIPQGSIALYVPPNLQFDYDIQYEEAEMKKSTGALANIVGKGKDQEAMSRAGGEIASLIQQNTSAVLMAEAQKKFGAGLGRVALNPHMEQIFKDVPFRTFQFDFHFTADSPEESEAIHLIIKHFKLNAMPELEMLEVGRFYKYPNEVKVEFHYRGIENKYIPKIGKCVITKVSTNYAPSNKLAVHYTGSPVEITMGISLLEIERIDQKMIKGGY